MTVDPSTMNTLQCIIARKTMRAINMRLALVCLITILACICQPPLSSAVVTAQQKNSSKKLTEGELEQLVKQLGARAFVTREEAFKRLEETPGALFRLRPYMHVKNLEVHKRVQSLIERISNRNFKKILRDVVDRKAKAPLDLLTDLVAENRDRMNDEDWQRVFETVTAVRSHLLTIEKVKIPPPDLKDNFLRFPVINGKSFTLTDRLAGRRVAGGELKANIVYSAAVFTTSSIEAVTSFRSILFANGDVSFHESTGVSGGSFVFSDQDVHSDIITQSIVVARGRIKSLPCRRSIVIEQAADSSKVVCFSLATIGLTVIADRDAIRVEQVAGGSIADQSGFKSGDIILSAQKSLQQLERLVRRSLARQTELVLQVRRKGHYKQFGLSVFIQ